MLGILFLGVTVPSHAQTVTVPHTFVAGNDARADQVNENFNALANGINGILSERDIDSNGSAILHVNGGPGTTGAGLSLKSTNEAGQVFINWITKNGTSDGHLGGVGDRGWHIAGRGNLWGNQPEQNDLMFWRRSDGGWSHSLVLDGPTGNIGIKTVTPEAPLCQ